MKSCKYGIFHPDSSSVRCSISTPITVVVDVVVAVVNAAATALQTLSKFDEGEFCLSTQNASQRSPPLLRTLLGPEQTVLIIKERLNFGRVPPSILLLLPQPWVVQWNLHLAMFCSQQGKCIWRYQCSMQTLLNWDFHFEILLW